MSKSKMEYYDYANNSLTAEEVILKVERVLGSVCSTLSDCDGDMWLSDYRQLMDCRGLLQYIKKQIEETD